MVYNVKAGIAAASSLAGTAMAYKNYGNNYGNNSGNSGATPQTKNYGNNSWQKSSSNSNNGNKLHDDAMKQMQMWKS